MAERPALLDATRPRFVGFRPVDRSQRLRAGAHFVANGREPIATNDEGFMTSVAYSPTLEHWIGLGLLQRGPERIGERLRYVDPLRDTAFDVEVCSPVFVDPSEERLRV
jgi:sarcosine oxidase subunit alpha